MLDDEDHLELHQGALESGIQQDDEDTECLMVKMLDDEVVLDLLQGVLLVLLVGLEALEDLHQLPLGELLKVTVLLRHLIHNVIYMVSLKKGTF